MDSSAATLNPLPPPKDPNPYLQLLGIILLWCCWAAFFWLAWWVELQKGR